jgi:hypothetical protein
MSFSISIMIPPSSLLCVHVKHHGRQRDSQFNRGLGTVQHAGIAVPTLFRIADHRGVPAIATGENVRGTYFGTDAAGLAFVVMNDGWQWTLLSATGQDRICQHSPARGKHRRRFPLRLDVLMHPLFVFQAKGQTSQSDGCGSRQSVFGDAKSKKISPSISLAAFLPQISMLQSALLNGPQVAKFMKDVFTGRLFRQKWFKHLG